VSRTLIPNREKDVPVCVLNISDKAIKLKANTLIANLQQGTVLSETIDSDTEQVALSPLDEIVSRIDPSVPMDCRLELSKLLQKYRVAFSLDERDIGVTNMATHTIDTGNGRPVRQAMRRHPPAHESAIRQQVDELLQQGIIEPARSPWASNVVMVKKDGSLRMCVDYRQVNALTRKDAYPIPRTDVCLDAMSGSVWFSTFDLRSCYHQVPLHAGDADKTAFICRRGMF